jgi:hypothetical protein
MGICASRKSVYSRKDLEKIENLHYIITNLETQKLMKIKELQELYNCQICFERRFNITYISCGHVICDVCDKQKDEDTCPFCRKNIHYKQSLYF